MAAARIHVIGPLNSTARRTPTKQGRFGIGTKLCLFNFEVLLGQCWNSALRHHFFVYCLSPHWTLHSLGILETNTHYPFAFLVPNTKDYRF